MSQILRVTADNIMPLWDQIEPLVASAVSVSPVYTVDDVRIGLMSQRAILWAQMDGSSVEAIVVTDFEASSAGTWLRMWIAGARPDVSFDRHGFFSLLERFARGNKCNGIVGGGRIGWLRLFPQFKLEAITARMTFDATSPK